MSTITENFQSSATVGTTEYFLASASTTATYRTTDACVQLWLEVNNLANGDEYQVRVYEKISSGGTARIAMEWTISHAQTQPLWVTPTLMLIHGWEFSLTKLTGTDRSIAWSIRSV
jgi:hypothetical protein